MQGASGISPMQKLCLLKLVRPECLVSAIQQYVVASLGPRFAEPGPISLAQVSKDSNNTTPIIFILSAGGLQFVIEFTCWLSSSTFAASVSLSHRDFHMLARGLGFTARHSSFCA